MFAGFDNKYELSYFGNYLNYIILEEPEINDINPFLDLNENNFVQENQNLDNSFYFINSYCGSNSYNYNTNCETLKKSNLFSRKQEFNQEDESNYTIDVDPGVEVIMPYVITPEQFGEYGEYGTKTLTYYADNVLTDEIDNPITSGEMETMIGPDALDHFGEYEDDSVYIRDEMNEMDYEILKSEKMFSEIPKRGRAN